MTPKVKTDTDIYMANQSKHLADSMERLRLGRSPRKEIYDIRRTCWRDPFSGVNAACADSVSILSWRQAPYRPPPDAVTNKQSLPLANTIAIRHQTVGLILWLHFIIIYLSYWIIPLSVTLSDYISTFHGHSPRLVRNTRPYYHSVRNW